MVLIDSVHIMVVWRRSVQLTRANYLIMHSTTVFWVVIYPPRSNLFVVIRVGPPPWKGDLKTFWCPPCRRRPWHRGRLKITRKIPWTEGFPQLRFPLWGKNSSIRSSDPQIRWLTNILRGLEQKWLGGWSLVGQITSGKLRSWPRVWYPSISWLTRLSVWLWSYIASCGTLQKNRQHKGGVLWLF